MKTSGYEARPDYRVDLHRRRNRVRASFAGRSLADSRRTLLVDEQNHGLVFYFPREDVDMAALTPMADMTSHCPYKGDANYWTAQADPGLPIAWSYEAPYAQVAALAGYVAFYQDRVEVNLGVAEP